MKKIILAVTFLIGISFFAQSQTFSKKDRVDTVIKTPNALCENCKKRIEGYLKSYDGVLDVNVNFRKGETRVKFLTDRINIEEIKAYIANCGYDANDVPAAEDMYRRLPLSCKKPEDGGGHPKPKVAPPPAKVDQN
ncbi:MAG: heavy-metal-associated domain-containing protein [Bacteroidetes bacterium]|nr:heavy-metal-associated domain-containing protein [Bacteroidota bacterium]